MSNTIPTFAIGDRVRVIDTMATRDAGIANAHGVVTCVADLPEAECLTRLAAICAVPWDKSVDIKMDNGETRRRDAIVCCVDAGEVVTTRAGARDYAC